MSTEPDARMRAHAWPNTHAHLQARRAGPRAD